MLFFVLMAPVQPFGVYTSWGLLAGDGIQAQEMLATVWPPHSGRNLGKWGNAQQI